VAIMPRGDKVDMHYLPAEIGIAWKSRRQTAPHFTVTSTRCDEIQASSPGPLKTSAFRIVREYDRTVDLEWV
jgi:hypothetical protein